jgi:hypothetical protein
MRAALGISVAVASFVLAVLALMAGKKPGFMEDYHIIIFDTSELGKGLTTQSGPSPTERASDGTCGLFGDTLGNLCASATTVAGAVVSSGIDGISNIENGVADKVMETLHIQPWYSLHILSVCEGTFSNATGTGYNVTDCKDSAQAGWFLLLSRAVLPANYLVYFDVSAILSHKLKIGPFDLDPADLAFVKGVQNELDKIPAIARMLAACYILAASLTALSLLFALIGFLRTGGGILLITTTITLLSALAFFAGNMVIAISVKAVMNKVNEFGSHIGLSAAAGEKFAIITWVVFALLMLMAFYWTYESRQSVRTKRLQERMWAGSRY